MDILIVFVGLLVFFPSTGWLIVSLIKKREKKKPALTLLAGLLIFFFGVLYTYYNGI